MVLHNLKIDDLLKLKFVSDPQISPNGNFVIFCVKVINHEKNCYEIHLYLGNVQTGEIRQFTFGEKKDRQPRWSPDGRLIAFLRTTDDDDQIWMIPLNGGEARKLTNLDEGGLGSITWSPNGSHIAFEYRPIHHNWTKNAQEQRKENGESNPPRVICRLKYRREGEGFLDHFQHIWLVDVATGVPIQITQGDWDDRDPTWSPDNKWIAFISNRSKHPDQTPYKEDLWKIQFQNPNQAPIRFNAPDGYKWGLSWSPVGKHLAYIGSNTQDDAWCTHNDQVFIVSTNGEPARSLNHSLDRVSENATLSDVRESGNQNPVWSVDGNSLYYLVSDFGNCHLYKTDLQGETQAVITGVIDISGFSPDTNGDKFALLAAKPSKPAEVFLAKKVVDNETFDPVIFTGINSTLLDLINVSEPVEIKFKSFDDTLIQGWLLKPQNFDSNIKYPLILYIHGGPAAQYGNTFFHEFQVLASNGYIVCYTNPRGSLGREEEFATCIQGNWGDLDHKDLMAAADYVSRLPFIDEDRMAVVGGSYGGYMTTWIIGNSQKFRCAISERGISNRHSAVGSNDFPPMPDGYWDGNPWNRPEKLWQQSPLRFAGTIKTPLLIIHSEGDRRCPISQAEQLFSALKKLDREVVFLRYPLETGHGFSRNGPPDLRVDRLKRIVNWLDKNLKPSEAKE